VIIRSAKLILVTDCTILLCTVVTSLVGARALGPAGRGDLLVIALWPLVIAMLVELGLVNSHRYWMAKDPEKCSRLFSNAVIYTLIVGIGSIALADVVTPHLVGDRSPRVMLLLRIYQVNIPAALFLNLMRGLLEGTRRFGWAGLARLVSFIVQAVGFAGLWYFGKLTVASATYTLILAQFVSAGLATFAVWHQLRPRWQPSWAEFKNSMHYGLRDYPGCVADFTTLRLDQLMLGGMASSAAIGLYVIAVRLSEVTTYVSDALAGALKPEVAGASADDQAELLLGRTLRLTIYANALILIPLWIAAPWILRILFGENFVPATGAFRWLLAAAVVWSAGTIVISGLQGFGYPGLSTIARFLSAVVTAPALLFLLPRMGIEGAAIASLVGYSVMLLAALVALVKRRRLGFWRYLRPQREDFPIAHLRALANVSWATLRGNES
jgi:O-antigen/teichoic acid export membrane protein